MVAAKPIPVVGTKEFNEHFRKLSLAVVNDDSLNTHPVYPRWKCEHNIRVLDFSPSALRGRGQSDDACRHKISNTKDGLQVEVSPCLDPYAPPKKHGMPFPTRSFTGTNARRMDSAMEDDFIKNQAMNDLLQHEKNWNAAHARRKGSALEEYYINNNQMKELLQYEKKWVTPSTFVIKDCDTMEEERYVHHVHHYVHHVHHHHDATPERHLHQKQPSRSLGENHYFLYTLVTLGIALVVSRLRVNVDVKVKVRNGKEEHDMPDVEAGPPEIIPMVPQENVVVLNNNEPHAVPI